jgi:hypothetical protein
MVERGSVNFDSPGYVPLGEFAASALPWAKATATSPASPPMIRLYACIRCGAVVGMLAEAGRLTHDSFHRELFAAGLGEM